MRNKIYHFVSLILMIFIILAVGGCLSKAPRQVSNYYILDYQKNTENNSLILNKPFPKTLEITDTSIPKTYSRNQLVVKEHFSKIKYLPNELWANRLYDAIPNLMVQRFKAYNIFQRVDRDLGEITPDYTLETSILNIEMIEDVVPKAYLRMEFFLRESGTDKVMLSYQNESTKLLRDPSIVYLVQSFNELIMKETDVFAAKSIEYLSDKTVYKAPQKTLVEATQIIQQRMEENTSELQYGELMVPMIQNITSEMQYNIYAMDEMDTITDRYVGLFNEAIKLKPGKYKAVLDDNYEVQIPVEIVSGIRSVINPSWGELTISVIDETRSMVRLSFDLYLKNAEDEGFTHYSQGFSRGEEEIGQENKIWLLNPGNYLVKLQGGGWNDYRDFATVEVSEGKSKTFTIVVDPQGERTILLGAGVLGDDELFKNIRLTHRGAVHTNIVLTSNNSVNKDEPTRSFKLSGQFDNKVEYHLHKFHYNMRSLYDLGMNIETGTDFKINPDDYKIRNTLLLLPFEDNRFFKNLGLYGRADLNTHFFDETTFFKTDRNILLINAIGDTTDLPSQSELMTKKAFYPLQMREGTGVIYRLAISPNVSISLRGGYGWQQDYRQASYTLQKENHSIDGTIYDLYKEESDQVARGFESTVILSAFNLLNHISISSTFDVLFPMETADSDPKFVNENKINIRLLRNVSLELKADIKYDKVIKNYIQYDYNTVLRMSVFY